MIQFVADHFLPPCSTRTLVVNECKQTTNQDAQTMTKEIWRILNHFYFEKQNQQLHELVCDFAEDQHGINLLSVRDFKVVEKKKRERGKSQPGAPRQQSESPMPPHYE